MNKTRCAFFLLLVSAWLGAAGHPALAAQLVPLGPEQDMYADVFSNPPAVAAQPDGSSVIAWDDESASNYEGTLPYSYFPPGQGPDSSGAGGGWLQSPAGVPDVDAVTAGRQGFDVIWHNRGEYGGEADEPTRFYRGHLNLRGVPVGKPVRLGGNGIEWVWQVRGNGFMSGWPLPGKHGIAARRLATSGEWTGPELRLNSRPIDRLAGVSVVGLADASFVAVWLGIPPGSHGTAALRARRFSPSGKPLGPDFDVNTIPLGGLDSSWSAFKVAAAPGGGFAVAWLIHQATYLRWFNTAGAPLGSEVMATTSEHPEGIPEAMAFDGTGDLVLLLNVIDGGLQLRLFDPQGRPQGPPVNVNSDFNDDDPEHRSEPWEGDLAWTGDSWLVTWLAVIFPYDQRAIYVRRFAKK
jgi:hypothetical protein